MDRGLSVAQAARRLACSEASVRRSIDDELEAVPNVSPLRVTVASVEARRRELLRQLGVPDGDETLALRSTIYG